MDSGATDAEIFIRAVFRYLHGAGLYEKPYMLAPMDPVFKFPPVYALSYLPAFFGNMDKTADQMYGMLFWPLITLHVARYLSAFVLVVVFFGEWRNITWLCVASIIFFITTAFNESLTGLTFENLLFFLLVLSFILLRFGWRWMPAFLLAFVCLAKLYPAALLVFFLARKEWHFLRCFAIACFVWTALAVLGFGLEAHHDFYVEILPVLMREEITFNPMNLSLSAFFVLNHLQQTASQCALVIVTALVIFFASNKKRRGDYDAEVALMFGFSICLPLLLLQNCWGQYQLILLFPILVLVASAFDPRACWRPFRFVIVLLAWLPMTVGYSSIVFVPEDVQHINRMLVFRDFSPLLLWLGIGIMLVRVNLFDNKKRPVLDLDKNTAYVFANNAEHQ